jgi:uncharacterized protein with FMN-binding domain
MNSTSRTSKKILLAIGVAATFFVYTFVLRGQRSGAIIAPTPLKGSTPAVSSSSTGSYKDGTYTGSVANAYYGNVQVQAVISGNKLTDVQFLQYPNDNPNSQYINQQATPYLKQEALQAQSAQVNGITGATLTSQAFTQSLSSALSQAKS